MSWPALILLRPLWLLAILPLAIMVWALWRRGGGLGDWERAADPALLRAMAALGRIDGAPRKGPVLMLALVAVLGVVALSGPAIERRDATAFRNLDGVLILLDVSSSMTDAGRWPQVLTVGRSAIAALGTRPAGLLVYAGDVHVATDMTHDHLQLGQTLSLVEPGLVPVSGSRPVLALRRAADLLVQARVLAGDVVILTDGAGFGAPSLSEAERIAEQGARLSVVAFGGDAPLLDAHAAGTGGRVFRAEELGALTDWLREDARTRLERQDYPLLFWHDLGPYVLALALLPLLALFRRERA